MKRIVIALLALAFALFLFAACAMEFSPAKDVNADVSVRPLNVEPRQGAVLIDREDAAQIIAYFQDLSDGRDHLCDCTADVCVVIGEQTFYYHSHSGILTEEGDETNIYYVGDNREAINEILKQYRTLRP